MVTAPENKWAIWYPLRRSGAFAKLVETIRKTKQTSTYIEKLGPFFIGKAVWTSSGKEG